MSRFNPDLPDAPRVFEAADAFKQRCLLDQKSLLIEGQLLWTTEHFAALIENYVKRPDEGEGKFYDKLATQLATCDPLDVALMAEVFWIVQLGPTNFGATTKAHAVERIWNIKPATPFPSASPFLALPALTGLGSAGLGYNNYLWAEVAFAIEAFSNFVQMSRSERQQLLQDGFAFAGWLDSVPAGKGRQFYHTLCHVLFPDVFERIFSQNHKNRVARAHKIWTTAVGDNRVSLDKALLELRKRLEAQYPGVVDYYLAPVGTLMKEVLAVPPAATPPKKADGGVGSPAGVGESNQEYEIRDAADVKPTLRKADNLVMFGPPGTGKTFEMQAQMRAAFERGEDFAFVAFHPSYSYEDFIGGLRPVASKDGSGVFVVYQKGPFLLLCDKAHANPTQQFTLFIDEINRANVAKVFGELITLIEPSKRVIAGTKPNDNGAWVTVPGLTERFGVPDNLNIVATMNTADRSVAMMDVALRRRFRFEECSPQPQKIAPAMIGAIDLTALCQRLNDRLEYLLDRDHTLGHSYFMGIKSLTDLQQVLAQRVIPLLQEYFFEDLERVRLAFSGSSKESVFFRTRALSPGELFPGAQRSMGSEARPTFSVGDPETWTEAHIMSLYGPVGAAAPQMSETTLADPPPVGPAVVSNPE